jgi:hypothetical protein
MLHVGQVVAWQVACANANPLFTFSLTQLYLAESLPRVTPQSSMLWQCATPWCMLHVGQVVAWQVACANANPLFTFSLTQLYLAESLPRVSPQSSMLWKCATPLLSVWEAQTARSAGVTT